MKKLICLTLLFLFAALSVAQQPKAKTSTEAMVETERAFAKLSEDQGTRLAFMAYIADDGILFRPRAVKGKQWMTDHPVPSSDKRPVLSWYPSVADTSLAGDLGYSTGPWEFKGDVKDEAPVAWGMFLTVWKRQADGSWKFAIDLGISTPKPEQAAAPWQSVTQRKLASLAGAAPNRSAQTAGLLARDGEFSRSSETLGARKAFADFALSDVHVYREGKFPSLGQEPATALLPEASSVWTWVPAAGDVSITDDLGYTYGAYRISNGEKVLESGNYLRIWKRQGNKWKVLFDLTNPVAPEKKN